MGGRFDWVDSFRLEDSLVDGVVDIFSEDDSPKDRLMEEVNARGVRFITWLLLLLLEPSARMGLVWKSCQEEKIQMPLHSQRWTTDSIYY